MKPRGIFYDEYVSKELQEYDSDTKEERGSSQKTYPKGKTLKDMSNYKWELGTIYGTKNEFKDAMRPYVCPLWKGTEDCKE